MTTEAEVLRRKRAHVEKLVALLFDTIGDADEFKNRNEAQRERERATHGVALMCQATAAFPDDGPIWAGHPDPTPIDWRALWTKAVGR